MIQLTIPRRARAEYDRRAASPRVAVGTGLLALALGKLNVKIT